MAESKYINQELRVGRDSILSIVNLVNNLIEDMRTRVLTAADSVVDTDSNYAGRTEGNVQLDGNLDVNGNLTADAIRLSGTGLLPINGAQFGAGSSLPAAASGGLFVLTSQDGTNAPGLYYSTDGSSWSKA